GDGALVQEREEFLERADTGPAGLDEGRGALIDADRVRVGEAQRAVGVHVDVDPARAYVAAGDIHHRGVVRRRAADRDDPAILDQNVGDAVDALRGIDHVPVFQQRFAGFL